MKITVEQLRRIIREVIEVHMAPDDLEEIGPEEAYGLGYYAGKDSVEAVEDGIAATGKLTRRTR